MGADGGFRLFDAEKIDRMGRKRWRHIIESLEDEAEDIDRDCGTERAAQWLDAVKRAGGMRTAQSLVDCALHGHVWIEEIYGRRTLCIGYGTHVDPFSESLGSALREATTVVGGGETWT